MKNNIFQSRQIFVIVIITLFVGAALGAVSGSYFYTDTVIVREGTPNTPAAMSSANLMLDEGNGTIKTWNTVSLHEAMSVLNLLETVTAAENISLQTEKNEANQQIVKSVDGIENAVTEAEVMRWQYWINNTYEPRVASKYYLKPGDIVLWKYVKEQTK